MFSNLQFSLTGMILPYTGESLSSGSGWLLCDGSSLLRSDYPDLFSIIGTNFGTVDGDHFNVPDLRGLFIKGRNPSKSTQADGSTSRCSPCAGGNTGSDVGSYEQDWILEHCHRYPMKCVGITAGGGYFGLEIQNSVGFLCRLVEKKGDADSRPKNVAINYIIKY